MQEIIKQVGSSRQLFETVNFAFMKIFDFFNQNRPFRGPFTESQFSQKAINAGFQTKWILAL